jgi:hypothetical protein
VRRRSRCLNTRVDHVGHYLDSATETLDIVDEVGSPHVQMLYDLYHSVVMGESPREVVAGRLDRVRHVQIADVPGRHEPGTGTIDLAGRARLAGVKRLPRADRTTNTVESLRFIRSRGHRVVAPNRPHRHRPPPGDLAQRLLAPPEPHPRSSADARRSANGLRRRRRLLTDGTRLADGRQRQPDRELAGSTSKEENAPSADARCS